MLLTGCKIVNLFKLPLFSNLPSILTQLERGFFSALLILPNTDNIIICCGNNMSTLFIHNNCVNYWTAFIIIFSWIFYIWPVQNSRRYIQLVWRMLLPQIFHIIDKDSTLGIPNDQSILRAWKIYIGFVNVNVFENGKWFHWWKEFFWQSNLGWNVIQQVPNIDKGFFNIFACHCVIIKQYQAVHTFFVAGKLR